MHRTWPLEMPKPIHLLFFEGDFSEGASCCGGREWCRGGSIAFVSGEVLLPIDITGSWVGVAAVIAVVDIGPCAALAIAFA